MWWSGIALLRRFVFQKQTIFELDLPDSWHNIRLVVYDSGQVYSCTKSTTTKIAHNFSAEQARRFWALNLQERFLFFPFWLQPSVLE
jgi:hypothetical protein